MSATQQITVPSDLLPEDAPQPVRDLADDKSTDVAGERTALDWLLGATIPLPYTVKVDYDTPAGLKTLVFGMHQVDDGVLQRLDTENRLGDPPFQKLDVGGFNSAAVAEACDYILDLDTGRRIDPKSPEFRGGVPSTPMAFRIRFKNQPGLLEQLTERIREKAGFGSERVGAAQRSVVEVGKPS
jgi:hypothetical protein